MAQKATIRLELPYKKELLEWADFESNKLQLAGFEWYVSGRYCAYYRSLSIYNTTIHCSPVGRTNNSIWNCEAYGEIVAFSSQPDVKRFISWSTSFNFLHLSSESVAIDWRRVFPENTEFHFVKSGSAVVRLDVQLTAHSHKMIHLSASDNAMIESPDDGAQVKVGEATLWLSKTILRANSIFFKAFFKNDFKEKLTGVYELKEINLQQFLHFISLLYGLRVRIGDDSVEYLLQLADYFQCDVVIDRCRDYLLHSAELSSEQRLKLAGRYGFFDVVTVLVQKMDAAEVKNCDAVAGLSSSTYDILRRRLNECGQV